MLLDLIVVGLAAIFAVTGYRRGFVLGILSFAGFLAGAVIGIQLAPLLADQFSEPRTKLIVAVGVALGCALLGQLAAFFLGVAIRKHMHSHSANVIDGIGGSVLSVVATFLVAWMIAAPLASAPSPWLASQVRNSTIIEGIDRGVPDPVRQMYGEFADSVRVSEFPAIFPHLSPTNVPEVSSPDPQLADSPVVRKARESVLKIVGASSTCQKRSTGSGFVYAPGRVMTNAHVVAGTDELRVEQYGQSYAARVILFDSRRDVAVLAVPKLDAPAMEFTDGAQHGTGAVVLGYPLDGSYTASPARVRERDTITGPDIYGDTVTRDVYSVRAQVQPGNSGGPLISTDGKVYGVVFAAALDDKDTGFALTASEVASDASRGVRASREVSTGPCR